MKHKKKEKNKIKKEEQQNIVNEEKENKYTYHTKNKGKATKTIYNKNYLYISLNIIFLIVLFFETKIIIKLYNNIKYYNTPFNDFEKSSFKEVVKIWKNYLDICKNDIIFNKETLIKTKEPIITAIITTFSTPDILKLAVKSIQNQNMKEIEIIIVNDNSDSKNAKVIEDLKNEDPRIKIINNDQNKGILYSRSISVLEAKGKYIIFLDEKDMFCSKDIFNILYKQTEEENYDIISFQAFENYNNNYKDYDLTIKKNKKIVIGHQPEISIYPIDENHPIFGNNDLIVGKLIKGGVIKAAVGLLGKERFSQNIKWNVDNTLFFIICNVAQSYKFVEKYGIFHYISQKSESSSLTKEEKTMGELFNLDILFDFSKNEYKNCTIWKLLNMKKLDYLSLSDENNKKYFKIITKKIMISDYIEEKDKVQVKEAYKEYNLID